MRMKQPFDRLQGEKHHRAGNEHRLAQPGQGFRLAVAKAVLAIGRLHGMMHGQQIDRRGAEIEQRIDR